MTDTRTTSAADWRAAVWAAFRADMLTRAGRDVMLTLASFRGPGGQIWPSHALLAARARVCIKTVVRAMQQAKEAGLLRWKAIRWRTPGGFWRRVSNLYVLRLPPLRQDGSEGKQLKIRKPEEGSRGRSVAQQLAALAVGGVVDARAALAQVAERMRERQRARLTGA